MIELALEQYLIIFALVTFAGFVDSVAGGGGLITVPTYHFFGVPLDLLLGTNKCVSSAGSTLSVIRYIKRGLIEWKVIAPAILFAIIGSFIGAQLSVYINEKLLLYLIIGVVAVVLVLNKKMKVEVKTAAVVPFLYLRSALIGLIIGGYDGFFGPGTGTFLLIAFTLFLNFDLQKSSANARVINYSSNLSALASFLINGKILWPVAAVGILGSLTGNWLGSGMVMNKPERVIQPIYRFVLAALIIKCSYDLYQMY